MKHLKIYETFVIDDINVNDYVILDSDDLYCLGQSHNQKRYKEFLNNNIGQIIDIDEITQNVKIKYYNMYYDIKYFFDTNGVITVKPKYIKIIGKSVEEVKLKYQSDKYNL